MPGISEIELPLLKLRDYQEVFWLRWFKERIRKASLEWHRRSGKDLVSLNVMIAEALYEIGNYWFILPEAQQIRKAIWEGITKDGTRYLDYFPESMILKKDNQSMSVHLRDPSNSQKVGSIVSFVGGDRYDKRVGAGLKGVVVSEHSLQKPNLYDLAIEPMLKETNGWVIFNYTPRGKNHATDMFDFLKTCPQYYTSKLTIKDTRQANGEPIVKESDLDEERARGKLEALIQQEYYCDREGALVGSYYGDLLKKYRADHYGNYPYDSGYPVHTLWDLGISDTFSIWFVQFVDKAIHVIDYYENTGMGLGHYASVVRGKGYMYAMHHLPHDGAKRELTMGERAVKIEQQLKDLGLGPIKIHEPRHDIYGLIQRVRSMLTRVYFDAVKTKEGYEALMAYRRQYDDNREVFRDMPYHDWACLPKGTLINIPGGCTPIEKFKEGDKVKILNVEARVIKARCTGVKNMTCLRLSNHGIICSDEHKIFTSRGLIEAKDIIPGDKLIREQALKWLLAKRKGIREVFTESFKGSNIDTGQSESFMQARKVINRNFCTGFFGNIIMGKFLKAMLLFLLGIIGSVLILRTGHVGHMPITASFFSLNILVSILTALSFMKLIEVIMRIKKGGEQRICIDMFGNFIIKKYQMVMQYIILILIRVIIKLKTFSLFQQENTLNYMIVLENKKLFQQETYDIEVEHHHAYVLSASGVVVSNSHAADAFSILPLIESTTMPGKYGTGGKGSRSRKWSGHFR